MVTTRRIQQLACNTSHKQGFTKLLTLLNYLSGTNGDFLRTSKTI